MMDSLNEQYRKEIDHMKQFQRNIQENKISITSWQNRMNQSEDRGSDLEDMMVASKKVRKDLLKTTRMQQKNNSTSARWCKNEQCEINRNQWEIRNQNKWYKKNMGRSNSRRLPKHEKAIEYSGNWSRQNPK